MGFIKITPTGNPADPALKIECRDCYPAGSGIHYADEFTMNLDSWVWLDPLRQNPAPAPPAETVPNEANTAAG